METLLCYEVGESKIHGRGVFATRNISKGDLIDTALEDFPVMTKTIFMFYGLKTEKADGKAFL